MIGNHLSQRAQRDKEVDRMVGEEQQPTADLRG